MVNIGNTWDEILKDEREKEKEKAGKTQNKNHIKS